MATLYTEQSKNVTKTWLLMAVVFVGILLSCPIHVKAQEKIYYYKNIDFVFNVNEDSTVDVVEKETFDFHGNFHNAFRDLFLNKVDDITDIEVIDAETNLPTPFTLLHQTGVKKVEWHYDFTDTTHTWILKYKLHGAVSFLKDHDELYWNLFTDFSVPINDVTAKVLLPKEVDPKLLLGSLYYSSATHAKDDLLSGPLDGKTFFFEVKNVPPLEMITIAPGWPKGLVSQTAYFKDAAFTWWPVILSVILLIGSIIFAFIYWFKTEKWRKGRGTIVPQYEPPQKLPPAIAEVLVKESVSRKTWPATLIDLAVRGYVTIEEDKPSFFRGGGVRSLITLLVLLCFIFVSLQGLFSIIGDHSFWIFPLFVILIILMAFLLPSIWKMKDYIVKKKKENDVNLKPFEAAYLITIFQDGDNFSTRELRASPTRGRALYHGMKALEKDLYQEVDVDTNAYEKKISKEKTAGSFMSWILVIIWAFLAFSSSIVSLIGWKFFILIIAVLISTLIVIWFLKFEARLSREGAIMREDWLGFKLYLETAERYRMQNLTPEIFEKYLPYAMIFGIEKKWAKAFESLNMNPPSWYGVYGGYHAGSGIGSFSGSGGFSASAFSSSLSSSFASAMGSSGAGGGASGGGGGAGGGGGGGGGGAS